MRVRDSRTRETKGMTMTRYYGFEIGSTDGKPAWFHNPQSALNFAEYSWGNMVSEPDADAPGGWVERERTVDDLDETTNADEADIYDGPDAIWTENNQHIE